MFRTLRRCFKIRYLLPILLFSKPVFLIEQQQQPINLTQNIFIQDILGNRKDQFFMVIYKEDQDGGLGEGAAIKVSQQLQSIITQLNMDAKVYIISRPGINKLGKLITRVKGIKIFDDDEPEQIEVYMKTRYSDDYIYFPYNIEKFHKPYKIDKIKDKIKRFQDLFDVITNKEQLRDIIQRQYHAFEEPVFICSNDAKSAKYYKKMAFQLLERKQLKLNSRFLLIDNQELANELCPNGDIVILRNDILQKYQSCQNINGFLIPQYENIQDIVPFLKDKVDSFNNHNSEQATNYSQFYLQIQQFALPRVIYFQHFKRSTTSNLIKKLQSNQLAFSLQIGVNSRKETHERLQSFFKLNEDFKDKMTFMISSTSQDDLEELIPHLNQNHTNFALFNMYKKLDCVKIFEKQNQPYQKYFIKDRYHVERYEEIKNQINTLLNNPTEPDLISQDQDKIQEINLQAYKNLCQNNIVLYYNKSQQTDLAIKILKEITLKDGSFIFSMSQVNQLFQPIGQNYLLINGQPFSLSNENNDIEHLAQEIKQLIETYLRSVYFKSFLQTNVNIPETKSTSAIYRTKTGSVPMSVYQSWIAEAQEKQLAIPHPNIDLPYNFEGIDHIPEIKESFMIDSIFSQQKISIQRTIDHLVQIYKGTLQAIADKDGEFLEEYMEKGLAQKTIENVSQLKERGDEITAFEDFSINGGEPFPYKGYCIDQVLIRGLTVDRSLNQAESYYHYMDETDMLGMLVFTPQQLSDPNQFLDQKNADRMYDDYQKLIMRLLIRIQSPMRLKVVKANGQILLADQDNYSYNHLVIFESQLEKPKSFKSFAQMENLQQWISKFKPSIWKIADIDNYIQGNPLIANSLVKYNDEVFKGTNFDLDQIDIRRV